MSAHISGRHAQSNETIDQPVFWEPSLAFLKFAISFILAGSAAFEIALLMFAPEQTMRALAVLLLVLVAGAAWFLLLRGRIQAAVRTLGTGVWTYVTFMSFFLGGVSGTTIVVYPLIILLVGWLVSTRAAVAVALLTAAVTLGFVLGEAWGLLPVAPPSHPAMRWVIQCCVLLCTTVLIAYLVRSYRDRLVEVRKLGSELAQRTAEVQAREADLNRAQAVAHVGSWVYELATDAMHLSAETCRIFGVPEGTTGSHKSYLSRVHPKDRGAAESAWQAALKGGEPFDNEHRIMLGETIRWVRQKAELTFDAGGAPLRAVGTTQDITDQKRAEEALRLTRIGVESTSDALFWITRDAHFVDVNRAACRSLGYTREELLQLRVPDIDTAFDAARWQQHLAELRRLGSVTFESTHRTKDGRMFPVEIVCNHVQIGSEERACAFVRNITERKRQEADVLAARSQLAATLDAIPDLLFEVGLDGRYHGYHSPRVELLAAPPEKLLGNTVVDVLPPAAAEICMSALREAHENGRSHGRQYELTLPQGRLWFEVSVSRKPVEPGQEPRFIVLSRDITERKRVEEALRESESQLQCILGSTADGILAVDGDGKVIQTNRRFAELWRIPQSLLDGNDDDALLAHVVSQLTDPEAFLEKVHALYRSNAEHTDTVRFKDGRIFERFTSPLILNRSLVGRVWSFRDITDRTRAQAARARLEAQLRESQKMEALGTLAGGIAHDFNNALASLMGNLELAREDVGPAHPAQVSLGEIAKAGKRAQALVQQILAFGRRQRLERKPTPLAPVLEESLRLLRATLPAGLELSLECAPDTPLVMADAIQIEQVLINLCTNAWHAIENQQRPGVIKIGLKAHVHVPRAARDEHTSFAYGNPRPGRYACLSVRDNGSGMNEATQQHIFEPFFTTKEIGKGTGLGLAVVHGILQGHEASIEVESAPGEGTTFRIYFPATDAMVADSHGADSRAVRSDSRETLVLPREGKRILYVDDDESIVLLTMRLLQRQGYRVSGYTDPREALAAVRADPRQFDLAVTDYSMPGMSGLDLVHALQEIRDDLPVALTSGYLTEELCARARAAGVREVIYKPNTVEDLCEAVARLANS